jgi:hypothetical protein
MKKHQSSNDDALEAVALVHNAVREENDRLVASAVVIPSPRENLAEAPSVGKV